MLADDQVGHKVSHPAIKTRMQTSSLQPPRGERNTMASYSGLQLSATLALLCVFAPLRELVSRQGAKTQSNAKQTFSSRSYPFENRYRNDVIKQPPRTASGARLAVRRGGSV